jgi:hypothetical protein
VSAAGSRRTSGSVHRLQKLAGGRRYQRAAIVIERHPGPHGGFREMPVSVVMEQEVGHGVVGHQNIRPPVAIVVGESRTHPLTHMLPYARCGRHIRERAVPVIVIQCIGQPWIEPRMAVRALPGRAVLADRLFIRVPVDIVHHEQIQPPVAIVIEPHRRYRPRLAVNSGLRSHVFKCAIPAIAVQKVALESGHEQIGASIVVVIGGGSPHAETLPAQTRFHGGVFERAISAIAIQPVPPSGVRLDQAGLARAIGDEDVHQPVAIVIEGGHATRHGFNLMLLRGGPVLQYDIESGACRRVLKRDWFRRGGRFQPPRQRQQQCASEQVGATACAHRCSFQRNPSSTSGSDPL